MNSVVLCGRLSQEPKVTYSQGEKPMAIAKFSVACSRKFAKKGEQSADFINCVAFEKKAEWIEKYIHKGMKVDLKGHIQTGSYTNKEGNKVYTTDVFVEDIDFGESRNAAGLDTNPNIPQSAPDDNVFMNIPSNIDDEIPFL